MKGSISIAIAATDREVAMLSPVLSAMREAKRDAATFRCKKCGVEMNRPDCHRSGPKLEGAWIWTRSGKSAWHDRVQMPSDQAYCDGVFERIPVPQ